MRSRTTKRSLLVSCIAVVLSGCASPSSTTAPQAELGEWGIDMESMKPSVHPGDNFFHYVNGTWLDTFEIPADFTNYGAFTALFERSEARVKAIIDDYAEGDGASDPNGQKIGDYYTAFLDTDEIERRGLTTISADFDAIANAATHSDIVALMGNAALSLEAPFSIYVYVDAKQTDRNLIHFTQAGLGLPNREYYLQDRFTDKLAEYEVHVAKMLGLAGVENPESKATNIVALEKRMAELHWSQEQQRDPNLTYNPLSKTELMALAPQMPWDAFFEASHIADQDEFIINELDAIENLAKLFTDTPVPLWRDYLRYHYLSSFAEVLPAAFDQENFRFYGQELNGQQEIRARWKRGVTAVNNALGEAVGKIYVERHFPAESKEKMDALIGNLRLAMAERIDQLDWMSDQTKQEARTKLEKFRAYIGYPDEWRDYGPLSVEPGDALGNLKRSRIANSEYFLARLGKPVEPGKEWGMLPHTVNAYYSPPRNAIYFPAAILQPPFFDPAADPAVNYGGIGAVIGHEIGHGFDDQGRKQDGDGLLRDWWAPMDADQFAQKTKKLGEQFEQYEPLPGEFINPNLTMGENVGDLGGLAMAYYAYKLSLNGEEAPVLSGYSGDQRFFMAWAQVWRRKYREDEMRMRMVVDPHSPSEFRTNGIVRNMDAWYDAFEIEAHHDLYLPPADRVSIW
ncbi:M13 family peptidase [Hyphococcus flavus]|uniref:M13 family peptidase n=1 Tax=Hyphococcus flavus TaxID=1866326 RepID=A0AAE9ZD10_9PROT|nr:M13-type metalloendopeptidase [Hyphococcus flavus]WDI32723.1 M13 family peptidase [Hyphococcus flavus]